MVAKPTGNRPQLLADSRLVGGARVSQPGTWELFPRPIIIFLRSLRSTTSVEAGQEKQLGAFKGVQGHSQAPTQSFE